MRQPVRFADGIRHLADDGVSIFLEVGPGTTLSALARETIGAGGAGPAAGPLLVSSLARGAEDSEVLLSSLGQVWVRGAPGQLDGGRWRSRRLPPRRPSRRRRTVPATPRPPARRSLVPLPATLFDAQIDHAHVSRTFAELRQGRLSMSEALTSIRAGIGPAEDGAS